jgi:hypothetical protein
MNDRVAHIRNFNRVITRRSGAKPLRLSAHRSLTEAQKLCRASGYRKIPLFDDEPYAHLAFEKLLK